MSKCDPQLTSEVLNLLRITESIQKDTKKIKEIVTEINDTTRLLHFKTTIYVYLDLFLLFIFLSGLSIVLNYKRCNYVPVEA